MVTPPPGSSWEIANIPPYSVPTIDKPSHQLPELEEWEDTLLQSLRSDFPESHTMLKPLVESEKALSFFGLKPGTPWTPVMGNYLISGCF